MSLRLRDLIKAVRACKTAAEERAAIAKECANIRTSIKEEEVEYRQRNVAKMLYIHMLGYSTQWGQMECLKLIASAYYADKRIGYLGLMILLDEVQEILTLVTNHMKNDLNHPNQFIAGLALCALGNISSAGIARDLAPEVEKLLGSTNPYLRKKAALCAIRVLRKCPDLMENFVPRIRSLLSDRNHGVLITAVTLMTELCETDPHNIEFFRRLVSSLVRILKNLVMSGYAPEYDVSGITDPFLQVKILKLLRILGKGDTESTDAMNDILAQVSTNTDHTRNVGNAVLYECVQTIMNIEAEEGLRLLAVNVLGRFLTNRDNNIRYVGLASLSKIVNADIDAVQRHRTTVVECLKDPDISIRKRALELIYALVNETNIKILALELLNFLGSCGPELRGDLAAKLCAVTERFAPSKRWQINTILKVLAIAGTSVPEEVISNLIVLIAANPDLHLYAVQKMYLAASQGLSQVQQQPLIQAAVWTIGEFGDVLISSKIPTSNPTSTTNPSGGMVLADDEIAINSADVAISVTDQDAVDLLEKVLRNCCSDVLQVNTITRWYVLTAMMKLTARFSKNPPVVERLRQNISKYQSSVDVELQQRSVEYSKLFQWDQIRKQLFEHVPPPEVKTLMSSSTLDHGSAPATSGTRSASKSKTVLGSSSASSSSSSSSNTKTNINTIASKNLLDLDADLTLTSRDTSTISNSHNKNSSDGIGNLLSKNASNSNLDLLQEIFGSTSIANSSTTATTSTTSTIFPSAISSSSSIPISITTGNTNLLASSLSSPLSSISTSKNTSPALLDLLEGITTTTTTTSSSSLSMMSAMSNSNIGSNSISPMISSEIKTFPAYNAYQKNGLTVQFELVKQASFLLVNVTFTNSNASPLNNFEFKAAVPKYVKLQVNPPTGSVVPPLNSGKVLQQLKLINTLPNEKPLLLKIKLDYQLDGATISEMADVSFPEGV